MPLPPISPDRLDFIDREPEPQLSARDWTSQELEAWDMNNSGIDHYYSEAHLGGNPHLKEVVERQLGQFATNVGLDIAGGTNGVALRDLMHAGRLTKGIVTNYLDMRLPAVRADSRLLHVEGGLTEVPTWQKMLGSVAKHAPDGLALIMHRPYGALQGFRPEFYSQATHLLLDVLRPGGVMFTQIPLPLSFEHPEAKDALCQAIRARSDVQAVHASTDRGLLATATIVKAD